MSEVERVQRIEAAGEKLERTKITDPISAAEYMREMFETLLADLPEEQRRTRQDFFHQWNKEMNEELVNALSAVLRKGQSVLSLSANPTSTLMWSHYAAAHTGFCIEYDFGSRPYSVMRKRMCFPVFYRAKRTDVSRYLAEYGEDFNNLIGQYLCLMKSPEWSYEQEWRIVHPLLFSRNNSSFTHIEAGCRCCFLAKSA